MAERKIDLPDDLLLSIPKDNGEEKVTIGFLDEVKDSESSIPLSPQWLYAKPSDAKDIRGPNSLSLGNSTDVTPKESDKKDWRKLASENESTRRWREEERETGLLGRRDRSRKTDRRLENVSVREAGDSRSLPSSERWHDSANRASAHEPRRDSKWSSRWGPEDKEKESRSEKKTDLEKEDAHHDAQSVASGNRDTESRDKWRPRHRMEPTGAPTPFRAAPGFGPDKGRADGPNMGFTVGRGRSISVSLIKPPLGSPVGTVHVDKNENIPGKVCLLAQTFRYPRAKLLDVYRLQKLDPSFAVKPDSMEEVPSLSQVEAVEPLAFVAPDAEEEAILKDIWKGKITGSGGSYNPLRLGKVAETGAGAGDLDPPEGQLGILPVITVEKAIVGFQNPANGDTYQAEERNAKYEENFQVSVVKSVGLMSTVSKTADITKAEGDTYNVTHLSAAENWQSSGSVGIKHCLVGDFDRAAFDISSKLPDDSSSLFVSQSFEDSRDNNRLYAQSERHSDRIVDDIPPEELSLYYCDPQGEIQGPFLGVDIISWFEQGFFGTDLPVRLVDAPEQAPFQELGDVMPHLKVQEVHGISSDFSTKMDNPGGSSATSEINDLSSLNNQSWRLADFDNCSNQPAYSDGIGFHDSSAPDEEIVFPGRPGSSGNSVGRLLRNADGPLTNPVVYPFIPNELKESGMPIQTDDKLHPFGLMWSELQGTDTRNTQRSSTPSSLGVPSDLVGHSNGRVAPFAGVTDPNVEEPWSKFYDKGPMSNSNMFGDSLDSYHFSHLEQEPNHRELAEQMMSRQFQQEQIQQRNLLSLLTHMNDSSGEQVSTRNSIQQQLANQPLSELEHFYALQQQRQLELQQHHHLQQQQQLHQQQILMQEQQSQARQQLLEQFLRTAHDPSFTQSHIDPSVANSALDQMFLKQQLLHDSQTRSHQPPRHSDQFIEQLIQAKLGHTSHQERHTDLLEMMQYARHEQFHPHQMLQQEQLQARQMSMGLRQRPEMGEGRPIGSVWPIDDAEQFLHNPTSHRANSAAFSPPAFSPLEMFQQQQRASHEEQLREIERNLQLQERLNRGLYDPGVLPFERPLSLPGGGPGLNLDTVNAMARFQGLDIQDPNSHMRSSGHLGSFGSETLSHHPHHPFARNEFNTSKFDDEGRWPDIDSRMSNDWIESHIQQLHLNAEQQKREQQLDEENSKRLLMELLHQKSSHQSIQTQNLNEGPMLERRMPSGLFSGSRSADNLFQDCDTGLINPAAVAAFANISGEQTQLRLAEEQVGGFDISGRLPGRSISGIVRERDSIYPGINQSSTLMYDHSSGKSYIDEEISEVGGNKRVPKHDDMAKGLALEIQDSMSKQPVMASLDGRDVSANSISRQSSLGISGGQGIFDENIGRCNSFSEEIAGERVPTVLSRASENIVLKRPPVSRPSSSQGGLSDLPVDPATKGMKTATGIVDGGRREVAGNTVKAPETPSTKKDMRFRRTNSCSDADVSETSFIDMLKSNAKKPPHHEAHAAAAVAAAASEAAEAAQGGKSGKKKGKKGRQIDPALLGFKVTSNRIMMGEIQRLDD